MKKWVAALSIVIALLVITGCTQSNKKDNDSEKLKVSTTVYPLKSFIEQIGGKHVEVESIYPAGTDLHSYEPTQKEILDVSKSDLFVYTGYDLDAVSKKIASVIKKDDKKLSLQNKIDQTELLTDQHSHEEEGHDHEGEHAHHHGSYDPHVWLDPTLNREMIKGIKDELVKKDPDNKAYYEENYKKLDKDLKDIDQSMKDVTKDHQGHTVFISHESLGYLAHRYGFVQKGVQGLNAEDPSQKSLTQMVSEIKESKAKYILYENNISPKIADTIRKETNAKTLPFNNMESLTKEQLNQKNLSYQSLMKDNIKNIEKALNDKITTKDDHKDTAHDKAIENGYFKNNQVKDRQLSDYAGDWQSVYPYLKDGTLDDVFKHKAEDGDMSAKEYKAYYDVGYKTDIENIKITDNKISFTKKGKTVTGEYEYDGYDILKYEKGNRGVRYTFKLKGQSNDDLPKYVQFSDHNIYSKKTSHFHIFMGDNKEKVLKELDNWPTYFPSKLTKDEVKEEMLAH
ncbi:zinc ABC transporter substrate-binding lipoprotein AdcA [Mammaliicoccus sp. Dog046]|uniref:zinc ABC transporter substrate-binding lipoprotein AdcA n=1 Tax=Mammaliicoccus sp. Dog046 TaxID=3034233 RepID=UPI002B260F84|nr:zinc ABC transporter substrate-binding lipoprotein AdcA [Mammaliicoccus sp. Dog046]WQK85120.1 zinc ABC transporter substrate-binding lipoprotein AdcA [Mammaliicoccus sp. Dog046]